MPLRNEMDWNTILLLMGLVLGALLIGGVWISVALAATGFVILIADGYGGHLNALASIYWTQTGNFVLVAIPLFILMGEIILGSGVSGRFYRSVTPWARFLPGGLYSTNIVASGVFSAVSGSSVATAAAIGSVAIPELQKRGYNDKLNFGTIASGGTLGILIPPSAGLIIYGSLVNENIARLFIAGVVPGILIVVMFVLFVGIVCSIRRDLVPRSDEPVSLSGLLRSLPGLLPIIMLITVVIGGIYSGMVTPTEAGALGVVGALVVGGTTGRIRILELWRAVQRSVVSTAMIMFIVLGAQILAYALSRTGTSRALVDWVLSMDLGAWEVFAVICLIYLVLGCFVDAISIMVLTLPLVHPLIVALGFDPIWFGIVLVMLIEVGMITPPVGLNLFVIQNFSGRKGAFGEIARGTAPFVLLILLCVLILCIWPQLVLWLPSRL